MKLTVLVDSLFPSYVLYSLIYKKHSHARTVTKTTDQNENSKRRVNRGAASGGGGRRSTWTLLFLAGSHFTGCRVEKHTELSSVYVGMRVGGFLKLNALLCLNHCRSAPLIYLVPGLLTSLPSLGSGPSSGSGSSSNSCSCSCFGFFAPAWARAFAQAQGFGHHLPSLPSAKMLAPASRWSKMLAPTSRRSIPTHQFASTSPQSSWTIHCISTVTKQHRKNFGGQMEGG